MLGVCSVGRDYNLSKVQSRLQSLREIRVKMRRTSRVVIRVLNFKFRILFLLAWRVAELLFIKGSIGV
jgi:hypothetical protein